MILVTGGTGLVGAHLLYRFRESETPIRATYRTKASIEKTRSIFESYEDGAGALVEEFEWVCCDITDIPALEEAMQGVTTIYHCAAAIHATDFRMLKQINVKGTANVVNVGLAAGVSQMCYVSSIAALGDPVGDRPVNEEDFFNIDGVNSDYAITKYGAEMEVWRATQEGMNVVIINPGVIIGEGAISEGSGKLFEKVKKGLPFYTTGSSGFIDVRDVVLVMQKLMDKKVFNQRFILVANHLTYQQLLTSIAQSLGVKAPKHYLSKWFMYLLVGLGYLGRVVGLRPVVTRAQIESLYHKSSYDGQAIKSVLDVEFNQVDQTIERVGRFYA